MIKWLSFISLIVFLGGCGAGSNLNIVSPSMSENEVRERANFVISEKTPAASSKAAAAENKSATTFPESAPSQKMKRTERPSVNDGQTQEALINLLEKKGIITKKELHDEMEKLGQHPQ
jgi:hypothetical protein